MYTGTTRGGHPAWVGRLAGRPAPLAKRMLSTRLMEGGRDGRGEAVTRRADMQQQQHSAAQDKHRPPRRHGKMSGRRGEEQHSGCMTGEGYRLGARQARASAQLREHRHCHRPSVHHPWNMLSTVYGSFTGGCKHRATRVTGP